MGYSLTIATAAQAGETEAAFEGFGWVLVLGFFGVNDEVFVFRV